MAITTGEYNTCGLTAAGAVECWGAYNTRTVKEASPPGQISATFSFGWTPSLIPNNLLAATRYSVRSLLFESKFAQAQAKAEAALRQFPNDQATRIDYVFLLADRGHTSQAIAEAQPIVQNKSEIDRVLFLARVYLRGGSFADAANTLESFERTNAQGSDSEELYLLKASALRGQKNFAAAAATLGRLLQARPNSIQTLYDLSYLLAEQNVRLDEALSLIRRAIELDPTNKQLLASSGWIHHLRGDSQAALDDLKQAWQSVARDPFIPERLGDVYFGMGNVEMALTHWQMALTEWRMIEPARHDADTVAKVQRKIATNSQRSP